MSPVERAWRLGTRRSPLALAQAGLLARALTQATGRPVELVEIVSEGDRSTSAIAALGGTGVFVAALRRALLAGEVDLAVHSLKDLPTTAATGLVLAAVPSREDPRDALVATGGLGLRGLAPGSRIGTGSPRRAAQLRWLRPDLEVVGVRGNVDTRVGLVRSGQLDGVVVALAGLVRLGLSGEASELFDPEIVLPAPGQGALAVECRSGSALAAEVAAVLDDTDTRAAVVAERAVLAALGAGCSAPVGALARVQGDGGLRLEALTAALDGSQLVRAEAVGGRDDPDGLGRGVAAELLAAGAATLVEARTR